MRSVYLITVLMIGTATAAYAQEGQNSHTLNEQMDRLSRGEAPIPAPWERKPISAMAPTATNVTSAPSVAGQPETAQPSTQPMMMQEPIDSIGGGAIPALPLETQKFGNISYITGGVGDEEMEQLKAQSASYNTHLLMNATTGEYISEAIVRINDNKGALVLNAGNAGPYLYVNLAPGKYTVEVTTKEGATKTAGVTVPAKGIVKKDFGF